MVKLVVSWVRTRFITFGVIAAAECGSRFHSTCVYLVFSTCNMKARIPGGLQEDILRSIVLFTYDTDSYIDQFYPFRQKGRKQFRDPHIYLFSNLSKILPHSN